MAEIEAPPDALGIEARTVRAYLAAAGLNDRWLADQLGVTPVTMSATYRRMSERDLERIGAVIDVRPIDLARGIASMRVTPNGVQTRRYHSDSDLDRGIVDDDLVPS